MRILSQISYPAVVTAAFVGRVDRLTARIAALSMMPSGVGIHPSMAYVAMMVPYIEDLFPDLAPTLAKRYDRTPGVIAHGQIHWPLP